MSLPPSEIPLGSIRFNSDSRKLEYWMGSAWMQIKTFSPTLDGGGRALFAGGNPAPATTTVDYITISSQGNAIDFGDTSQSRAGQTGAASNVRGVASGGTKGVSPYYVTNIDFYTISSTGDATDFGDSTDGRTFSGGCSNQTRACFGGGGSPSGKENIIDFVTIATTGDATDFGDAILARGEITGCCSDNTRGVFSGGNPNTNAIEKVTIATTGNGKDFGDLLVARRGTTSLSDSHGGLSE